MLGYPRVRLLKSTPFLGVPSRLWKYYRHKKGNAGVLAIVFIFPNFSRIFELLASETLFTVPDSNSAACVKEFGVTRASVSGATVAALFLLGQHLAGNVWLLPTVTATSPTVCVMWRFCVVTVMS